MSNRALTPEDLETLLEDTLVLDNWDALGELFEEQALLTAGTGCSEVRGAEEISRLASGIWADETYLANVGRVLQARDLALILTSRGVNVVRRGDDGSWRYVILALHIGEALEERTNR